MAPLTPPPARALSLDALRGLAILAMCFSGVVPWSGLPSWMYHAQLPPPSRAFVPTLAGFTWVDLVFPAFLFCMGAAFPLAFASRFRKGLSRSAAAASMLWRGIGLLFFAVFVQHMAPYELSSSPNVKTWLLALVGFAILFPIYMKLPEAWPSWRSIAVRTLGIAAALIFLGTNEWNGKPFSVQRVDIIILFLANMALFGGLVWLVIGERPERCLAAMALVAAGILAARMPNSPLQFFNELASALHLGWAFEFEYLRYLLVVLPGVLAGQVLQSWQNERVNEADVPPPPRLGLIVGAVAGLVVLTHTALQARWTFAFPILFMPCALLLCTLRPTGTTAHGQLLQKLLGWGTFWLLLGLVLEPTEGGIKKDEPTFSYFFVSSGLSCYLLIILFVFIDIWKVTYSTALLVSNGQNPMIAYVGIRNLLPPLVVPTGLENWIFVSVLTTPWPRVIWALAKTAALAGIVHLCTRRRIFWRT